MIRKANESDFIRTVTTESELRICALKQAYGVNVPFIQYFADENGSIAALMDGFCTFHSHDELNDEWVAFFLMHPDIHTLHTTEKTANALVSVQTHPMRSGHVLRLLNVKSETPLQRENLDFPRLDDVYAIFSSVFDAVPSFDAWYVDASHRVRHGCCHIVTEYAENRIASIAMTVAETETAALIGGVATLPNYRGHGLASRCINTLISNLKQPDIFIAPSSSETLKLYVKLGFRSYDTWAEVDLSR